MVAAATRSTTSIISSLGAVSGSVSAAVHVKLASSTSPTAFTSTPAPFLSFFVARGALGGVASGVSAAPAAQPRSLFHFCPRSKGGKLV